MFVPLAHLSACLTLLYAGAAPQQTGHLQKKELVKRLKFPLYLPDDSIFKFSYAEVSATPNQSKPTKINGHQVVLIHGIWSGREIDIVEMPLGHNENTYTAIQKGYVKPKSSDFDRETDLVVHSIGIDIIVHKARGDRPEVVGIPGLDSLLDSFRHAKPIGSASKR